MTAKQLPLAPTTEGAEVSESGAVLQVIERAASSPTVDVEKMERLLAMHERILERNAKQQFSESMNKVQTAIKPILADEENKQTKSKYATYEALDEVIRPIYTANGFSLSFGTEPGAADYVRVICDVMHTGGHEKRYQADMPADGKGAKGGDVMTKTHATGAAMSYGMRYLLKMIFNVAIKGEDDDGNGATDPKITETQLELLRRRLDASNSDVPNFCKYMKVDSLPNITQSKLKMAHDALDAKGAPKK